MFLRKKSKILKNKTKIKIKIKNMQKFFKKILQHVALVAWIGKTENNVKKNIQLFLIIWVVLVWFFSIKTIWVANIQDFSAKIISENFLNSEKKFFKENKKFLTLENFLEKIKSWKNEDLKNLEKTYWIKFPKFWEILDEKVTSVWQYVYFYFEV